MRRPVLDDQQRKKCRKCGLKKPLSEFVKSPQCVGGFTWSCKACISALTSARYRAKMAADPMWARTRGKRDRALYPERIRLTQKKRRIRIRKDPLKSFDRSIRFALCRAARRPGIKNRPTPYFSMLGYSTREFRAYLSQYWGKLCQLCLQNIITPEASHLDHIDPAWLAHDRPSLLAIHQLSNIRLICPQCNREKGSKASADALARFNAGRAEHREAPVKVIVALAHEVTGPIHV